MFTAKACYNATFRGVEQLPEQVVVTRIGRLEERFNVDSTIQALGTCGVITSMILAMERIHRTEVVDVLLDDGIDAVRFFAPRAQLDILNLGQIVKVTLKNKVVTVVEGKKVYESLQIDVIDNMSIEDFAVGCTEMS